MRLWRVSDGALLAVLAVSDTLNACRWHPRGDVLVEKVRYVQPGRVYFNKE